VDLDRAPLQVDTPVQEDIVQEDTLVRVGKLVLVGKLARVGMIDLADKAVLAGKRQDIVPVASLRLDSLQVPQDTDREGIARVDAVQADIDPGDIDPRDIGRLDMDKVVRGIF